MGPFNCKFIIPIPGEAVVFGKRPSDLNSTPIVAGWKLGKELRSLPRACSSSQVVTSAFVVLAL
jgi:hypothetical protein